MCAESQTACSKCRRGQPLPLPTLGSIRQSTIRAQQRPQVRVVLQDVADDETCEEVPLVRILERSYTCCPDIWHVRRCYDFLGVAMLYAEQHMYVCAGGKPVHALGMGYDCLSQHHIAWSQRVHARIAILILPWREDRNRTQRLCLCV